MEGKMGNEELECMECGSSVDLLKLSLTDLDGILLDQQMICRNCAKGNGWAPGDSR